MSSERFEKSITDWYEKTRSKDLEYLNLEVPKPKHFVIEKSKENLDFKFDCFHKNSKINHEPESSNSQGNFLVDLCLRNTNNIDVIFDRVSLLSRVSLKHFHTLRETLSEIQEKSEKFQREISEELRKIENQLLAHEPLTKRQVKELVIEIAQQPKLVEAEALKLTEELKSQVRKIEELIQEVKSYLIS